MPDIIFKQGTNIIGVYKSMAEASRGIKETHDIKGFALRTLKQIIPVLDDNDRKKYKREKNNYSIEWRENTESNKYKILQKLRKYNLTKRRRHTAEAGNIKTRKYTYNNTISLRGGDGGALPTNDILKFVYDKIINIKNYKKKKFRVAIVGGDDNDNMGTGYDSYESVLYELNRHISDYNQRYDDEDFYIKHIVIDYFKMPPIEDQVIFKQKGIKRRYNKETKRKEYYDVCTDRQSILWDIEHRMYIINKDALLLLLSKYNMFIPVTRRNCLYLAAFVGMQRTYKGVTRKRMIRADNQARKFKKTYKASLTQSLKDYQLIAEIYDIFKFKIWFLNGQRLLCYKIDNTGITQYKEYEQPEKTLEELIKETNEIKGRNIGGNKASISISEEEGFYSYTGGRKEILNKKPTRENKKEIIIFVKGNHAILLYREAYRPEHTKKITEKYKKLEEKEIHKPIDEQIIGLSTDEDEPDENTDTSGDEREEKEKILTIQEKIDDTILKHNQKNILLKEYEDETINLIEKNKIESNKKLKDFRKYIIDYRTANPPIMDDEAGIKQDIKIKELFKNIFYTKSDNLTGDLAAEGYKIYLLKKKKDDEKTTDDYKYLIKDLKQCNNKNIIYILFIIHCNTRGTTDQRRILADLKSCDITDGTTDKNIYQLKDVYNKLNDIYLKYDKIESLLTRNLEIGTTQYQYIV